MSNNKKSPIKDKTLRHPGQSLDEKLYKLVYEDGTEYYFTAAILLGWMTYEWLRYFRNSPPIPHLVSLFAVVIVPYCVYKIIKIYKETRLIILGREGER
jgi:hypothetical protein